MSTVTPADLLQATVDSGLRPIKGYWDGTTEQVAAAAEKLGLTVPEYIAQLSAYRITTFSIDVWFELCKKVHHAFEYGFHCNDMTLGEVEEDIAFALDEFARGTNLPVHDWDADYEETYGEAQADQD
jgi:hypothetical protein